MCVDLQELRVRCGSVIKISSTLVGIISVKAQVEHFEAPPGCVYTPAISLKSDPAPQKEAARLNIMCFNEFLFTFTLHKDPALIN